jgi:uncharacterized protein YlxW (UPF0749 family)
MNSPVDPPATPPSPTPPDVGGAPHEAAGDRTTASRGPSRAAIRVLVGVLCALLGFALVLQVQRTAAGDTLETARADDLVQILDGLLRREDELNAQIAELQDTLGRLRSSGASAQEALAEAERRAEALGILTGTVAAEGPGVRIVIADPETRVPPEVLLDAIQELRNAGAEAFAVDDVRVGVDSAFTGSPGAIWMDGTLLAAPYVIQAIGDPPTLAAALSIAGGVFDTVRRAGGSMEVEQIDPITIDALRPLPDNEFASPGG